MKTHNRQQHYQKGKWAEFLACVWLMGKGFWPLARRYKTQVGEIDLVMRRGRLLLFVEVKARPTITEGLGAITPTQQQRWQKAVGWWLMMHPAHAGLALRCDVVIVRPMCLPYHVANIILAE